jgi:hypothetical protein
VAASAFDAICPPTMQKPLLKMASVASTVE